MDNKSSASVQFRPITWLIIITKLSKLVKLVKFAKLAKPMITVITMSISAIAYAFWLGPWFAIGLVVMIFIHEMGHVIAMKMRGYELSAPVFIPFLGAVIFAPRMNTRDDEAFIGIGGPILGGLAAAVTLGIWFFIEDKESDLAVIILMISYIGMFINVFNLMPIRPLDGGRVTQAVGSWFKYVGVAILVVFSAVSREPVVLFIWILVMPEITFLSLRLRVITIQTMWFAMVALMLMGYSSQPFWVDLLDCVLAGVIALDMMAQAARNTDIAAEDDDRPHLQFAGRVGWFVRYAVLIFLLVGLMMLQVQHLPTVDQ